MLNGESECGDIRAGEDVFGCWGTGGQVLKEPGMGGEVVKRCIHGTVYVGGSWGVVGVVRMCVEGAGGASKEIRMEGEVIRKYTCIFLQDNSCVVIIRVEAGLRVSRGGGWRKHKAE